MMDILVEGGGEFVEKFPLLPDADMEQRLLAWLETCRKVWNLGCDALRELDSKTSVNRVLNPETGKETRVAYPSCRMAIAGDSTPRPVVTNWFKNKLKDRDGRDVEVWAEHCWILPKGKRGGTVDLWTGESTHEIRPSLIRVGQCCPLPIPEWSTPRLGIQVPGKYSLQYFFTQANVSEHYPYLADEFKQIPQWFVRGVCDSLWRSWSRYKSGGAGEPRFKGVSDPITSLSYGDAAKLKLWIDEKNPNNGAIAIPKLGRKRDKQGKEKIVPGILPVVDLGRRFTIEDETGNSVLRLPSVARIVLLPSGKWQLHLTAYEPTSGEIQGLAKLVMAIGCREFFTPFLRLQILLDSWWSVRRRRDCTLTVPGEGYVVGVDDRGWGYTVLPRRHQDGAIDPHNLIAKLDSKIEELQRQISWKQECSKRYGTPRHSNRLKELKRQKRKLQARRAAILRSNRQKIVYFISERSRNLKVVQKPSERIRRPKPRLKDGTNPAVFEPNGAGAIAEINKMSANASPGEFVALLKHQAARRGQRLIVEEVAPKSKKRR